MTGAYRHVKSLWRSFAFLGVDIGPFFKRNRRKVVQTASFKPLRSHRLHHGLVDAAPHPPREVRRGVVPAPRLRLRSAQGMGPGQVCRELRRALQQQRLRFICWALNQDGGRGGKMASRMGGAPFGLPLNQCVEWVSLKAHTSYLQV